MHPPGIIAPWIFQTNNLLKMGTKNKNKKNTKQNEINIEVEKTDATDINIDHPESADTTELCISAQLNNSEQQNNAYRKRKKHYYNAIRAQMEFYFGDANLSKDRFLKQLIDKDPYVPLETFMTFNKMKVLTSKVEDIAKSLSNSQLLELDESQQKVKRRIPLDENRNVDEKTLYVEALPSTADHEWVRQIFERFGKVVYVSLPKYTKSRKIKEFGFIEFEKEESVNKAINTFKEFNGVLNMQEKDPADLVSVKSFIKEQSCEKEEQEDTSTLTSNVRKRPINDVYEDDTEQKAKKHKAELQDDTATSNTENETTNHSESGKTTDESKLVNTEEAPKRKKRKRKKKSKNMEKLKRKAELNTDVAYYELKILPKKDWKRLRNKYLNLQREKVAEIKRKAWREQQELKQQRDSTMEEKVTLPPSQQEHKINSKSGAKHKLQKMNMNFYGAAEEEPSFKGSSTEKITHQNPALDRAPLFSYEPGLIVEVSFLEPCINIKEFKADMRQYNYVKYVDIKEGAMQAFLRMESSAKAVEFVQTISCAEYQCKILSDEAEISYWKKIEKDREQKLNKQVKIPQKRGREKVKKLISKHIRFGDDDE